MIVKVLREAGIGEALLGVSLSYNSPVENIENVARKLCSHDGGHNKFLESIQVWLDVTAPRYFWQQFDTYRVGVTKQSESTMHTLMRRNLSEADFEGYIPISLLCELNKLINDKNFEMLKALLPEGFLQRRIVCLNYKALRNIFLQRMNHRLTEWRSFTKMLREQLQHYELLGIEAN